MRLTDLDPERVSAAFVARQDGLGDWTGDLPGRLATITAGAREQA